jgi:hypothetical protein
MVTPDVRKLIEEIDELRTRTVRLAFTILVLLMTNAATCILWLTR